MNIDDEKIKFLIYRYKHEKIDLLSEIADMLAIYVYNYPRIVFKASEDVCSDFYEYILRNLDKILNSYSICDARFITWFTIILRTRFFTFIKHQKSTDSKIMSLDRENVDNVTLHNKLNDYRSYNSEEKKRMNRMLDEITVFLSDKMRLYFHLYYVDIIRPEDIRFVSVFLKRGILETVKGINKIKAELIERTEKKINIETKLEKIYQNIIKAQEVSNKIGEKDARKRQLKLLNEYMRVKTIPSYNSIAEFCGVPSGTVSSNIARMKRQVRKLIPEKLNGFV